MHTERGWKGWLLPPFLLLGEIFTAVSCDKKLLKTEDVLGIHSAGNDKSLTCGKGHLHQRGSYRLQRTT